MATSSIHKPGWRSRRRSRLSLVERAVPRLGRAPDSDDTTKTPRAAEALSKTPHNSKPKAASSKTAAEVKATTPSLNGAAELVQARSLPADEHDQVSKPTLDDQPALESVAAEVTAPAANDGEMIAPKADGPVSPSKSKPASETPRASQDTNDETRLDAAPASMVSTALSAQTLSTPKTAVDVEADDSAPRADAEASPTHPTLALDWDRMIEGGYTDPRDRGRPLPRNMDQIIRVLIRQALSDQSSWRDRVILVTSPNERAGKTTAAINFAFGLTTVGRHHAVLVDVDTAGPGAVDRLGGGDRTGITAALVDDTIEIDDVVIRTDLDRLTLVASGPPGEDVLDHFASRRMLEIMRHLTEHPETILVIDAPPILVSQEAAVLSVIAGQVVLAVEAGRTTADEIEHALQRIGERHNVSLALNESNGVAGEGASSDIPRHEPAIANRRAPSVGRRLSKVAAAGAMALGLISAEPAGHAGPPPGAHVAPDLTTLASSERWPNETTMPQVPCRRSCR